MDKKPTSITMMKRYIELIRQQKKTVEARVGIPMIKNIRVGQLLRFFYMSNAADSVVCQVVKIEKFNTFKEMLEAVGWEKCLPTSSSLEEALDAYLKIPNYEQRQATHSVFAIHLKLIK